MALVQSSNVLNNALWTKDQSDEKRPPEHTPTRRHSTSSSSNAETCESGSSANTSSLQSSVVPPSLASTKQQKQKQKKKTKRRGPEFILHVQDCAFPLHHDKLKHKCNVLYTLLQQLRTQNIVVEHTADDVEPINPTDPHVWTGADPPTHRNRFILRQHDPHVAAVRTKLQPPATTAHRTRCPLVAPRHRLTNPTPTRFSRVCCLVHQRQSDDSSAASSPTPPQQQPTLTARPRQLFQDHTDHSPGKENYVQQAATPSTPVRNRDTSLLRSALAPKMPFLPSSATPPSPSPSSKTSRSSTSPQRQYAPSTASSTTNQQNQNKTPTRQPFRVQLVGADPDAVAVVIDFLYTGRTTALTVNTSATVSRLCKWLCLDGQLLDVALIHRAHSLNTVHEWMDLLLACTVVRSAQRRDLLVNHLLGRLLALAPLQYAQAMQEMPVHSLAAVEDATLLSKIVLCMVNHVRRVEIWQRLATTIELWLHWQYHKPFVTAGTSIQLPMSLLDFHHEFASWDPLIRLQDHAVMGVDAYVHPKTLFTFGPYVFQVRLELTSPILMFWRVTRSKSNRDQQDVEQDDHEFHAHTPIFTLRGRLRVQFHRGNGQLVLQDDVALRYTHSASVYNTWQPLVSSRASRVNTSQSTDADETKPQDQFSAESSSEEETAPLHDSTELTTDPSQPNPHPHPPAQDSDTPHSSESLLHSGCEQLVVQFNGQVFAWGHKLCNLYHFLLLSTLFYQLPADAPAEMRREATLHKMRQLPFATLLAVLDSDRLRVPEGESTVAAALGTLCLSHYGHTHFTTQEIQALFVCVRWCYVDLDQTMLILENAPREIGFYEIVERQLFEHESHRSAERRAPWGVNKLETPYRVTTTLVEFQIEAGDRSLSPSKFLD